MNAPQIHLMLNHVPVLGIVFVVVMLAVGLWSRSSSLMRFALATVIAISLAALPVFLSGKQSEEPIEHLAGVEHGLIEQHEEVALVVTLGLALLGVASLGALIFYRRRAIPPVIGATMLAAAFVLGGAMAWTAHLGGQIRHGELRGTTAAAVEPIQQDEHGE